MIAGLKTAAMLIAIPLIFFMAGIWAGVQYQQKRSIAAENAAMADQARVIEDMLTDAARRATERRETIETLQKELDQYEAGLDGACRLDDADLERLRQF